MNATARPRTPPFGRIAKLPSGHEMHYLEQGKGPAIVLVHGWSGSMELWKEQFPVLAKAHRVLVLDLPGHGGSDKPR